MKILVNSATKNKFSSLFSLLNHYVEKSKKAMIVEKVRLDGWFLTYFEENRLKEIVPSDYREIVIYLEELDVFKKKTEKMFFESIQEIETLLSPASNAFKSYDLTRANILLETILEGLNSVLAYIDTLNPTGKESVLQKSLACLDRLVICQETEKYEEIGEILRVEIKNILELAKSLF